MKSIRNNIKWILPFIICFVIVAALFCLLYTDTSLGDDYFFKSREGQSFWTFIKNRANARIAVDSILTILLQLPQWVWGILTGFLFASVGYSIVKLFSSEKIDARIAWFAALLLLMYDFTAMNEAGWYSTTVNYIWPLSFGLFSLIPIKNALSAQSEPKALIPVYVISVIIGCGQEQMAAIVTCFYLIFTAYLFIIKQPSKLVTALCTISIICLLFMLFGGDNKERIVGEAGLWFPDFDKMSFLDKCYLGVTLTAMDLVFTENPLVTAFAVLFPLFIYKTDCRKWVKGISLVPIILESVNNIFYDYAWRICPKLEIIVPQLKYNSTFGRSLEEAAAPDWSATIILVSAMYILPILICTYMTFKDRKKYVALLIALAGFASRFIIGFSPSVYGAGYRTHIFLIASFICLLVLLLNECKEKIDFSKLFAVMSTVCALQLLKMEYYTTLIK